MADCQTYFRDSCVAPFFIMKTNYEKFPSMSPATLKVSVADLIRGLIFDGVLAPGIEINQVEISVRLGVSRGPLREALATLENEGLVNSVPFKGVTVSRLTREYVEELFQVRSALEVMALSKSINSMSGSDLDGLNRIVGEMQSEARVGDVARFSERDLNFHRQLIQLSKHALAFKLWSVVEVGIRRCLRYRHNMYPSLVDGIGSHPDIMFAVQQRDLAAATSLLVEHINESLRNMMLSIRLDGNPQDT